MLAIPLLILFIFIPAVFWFRGRRFLGEKTHPAAIFILGWMSASIVLTLASVTHSGAIALLWLTLNFSAFAIASKFRKRPETEARQEQDSSNDDP